MDLFWGYIGLFVEAARITFSAEYILASLYVAAGMVTILWDLLFPKKGKRPHASFGSNHPAYHENILVCGDDRFYRFAAIFGGAAGFSFGMQNVVLAQLISVWHLDWLTAVLLGATRVQFMMSIVWCVLLVYILVKHRATFSMFLIVWLLAHFLGCGWITAIGAFWPLYWIQKIFQPVRWVRDVETAWNWVFSIPVVLLFNIITVPASSAFIVPGLTWDAHPIEE